MRTRIVLLALLVFLPVLSFAQGSYKKPPKEIMDVLDAPAIPGTSISPSRDKIALLTPNRYPPIAGLTARIFRVIR